MTQDTNKQALQTLLTPGMERFERDRARWLVEPHAPDSLDEGMRYCTDGGKRLRPSMVYLAAEAAGGSAEDECVRRAALAVELIHSYSLVHDDLPCMDDDELRRGRPTAHVQYGEAMAVLIGDALLTRAFGLLGETNSPQAGSLVAELAAGAGPTGMVGGQVADMGLCDVPDGVTGLTYIHYRKTAALIIAAARMGAVAADADARTLAILTRYAEKLGLGFQLVDDLLDVTATAEELGKTPGKDMAADKRTHVAELGQDAAAAMAEEITEMAIEEAGMLGPKGEPLVLLARLLLQRNS